MKSIISIKPHIWFNCSCVCIFVMDVSVYLNYISEVLIMLTHKVTCGHLEWTKPQQSQVSNNCHTYVRKHHIFVSEETDVHSCLLFEHNSHPTSSVLISLPLSLCPPLSVTLSWLTPWPCYHMTLLSCSSLSQFYKKKSQINTAATDPSKSSLCRK